MPALTAQDLTDYLSSLYQRPVRLLSMTREGIQEAGDDLKGFGYGAPLFLEYEVNGETRKAVLETMAPSPFGHDHFSDRAQAILWEHASFNKLPRHVPSLDSGAFLENGKLISLGQSREFFLLTEFVQGRGYFKDLERIRDGAPAGDRDFRRVTALSDYLVQIHSRKSASPALYTRRIRELLGHGECIMGIIDNYPASFGFIDRPLLQRIETACLGWRWKIKDKGYRLCQVHGDFHPWNILFREEEDFTVLDRSRGEWGEPADDAATLSINYLFFSVLRTGRLDGDLEKMFRLFWDNYLGKTGDREMLEIIAPFYAWRGLVIASPVWYPHLSSGIRKTLFNFIENILASDRFDPAEAPRYLK